MTLQPINGKIVVKPQEVSKTSKGGVILSVDRKDETKPEIFRVVSIAEDVEIELKKGDEVIVDKYNVDMVEVGQGAEKEKYGFVSASDVFAIIKK